MIDHHFSRFLSHARADTDTEETAEWRAAMQSLIESQGAARARFILDELALMAEQFAFHSKDDSDSRKFQSDSAEKQSEIADADKALVARMCAAAMHRLDVSPANLFPHAAILP